MNMKMYYKFESSFNIISTSLKNLSVKNLLVSDDVKVFLESKIGSNILNELINCVSRISKKSDDIDKLGLFS